MNVASAFFYLFAGITVASGLMVISSRNPVHAVLFLILTFVNAAGLFVLMGAEFLAMILIVVYVGAVAVLFLFVVMMLDVDFAELRQGFLQYLPVGALVGLIILVELALVVGGWASSSDAAQRAVSPAPGGVGNTHALGQLLYTDYMLFFQLSGLILLVAMIGAIVLTLRHKAVRRQNIAAQNARSRANSLRVRKVSSGQGL